jgi:NodT family efflux transporter outer membrane factor (OMF) lipoprotein
MDRKRLILVAATARTPRAESSDVLSSQGVIHRLQRLAALAALLPLLGACALDKPALDSAGPAVPAQYRAARAAPAPAVDSLWARGFGSAELARLVEQAASDNLDIAAAAARITQAEAQARIAAAGLFPQVSGSADASYTRMPGTTRSANPPFRASFNQSYGLGLNASYALDFWGKYRANAEAGRLSAEASRYDRDTVVLSTTAAVANTYLALLAAQDRLVIARENIQLAGEVLKAEQARLAVGTATALDVAQQESLLAQQRAALPGLTLQAAQNRNLLAVLLGRTPQSVSVKGGSLRRLGVPRIRAGLPSQLLARRPDIAAAEAALSSADASVIAARAAFLPDFQLTAQGGLASMMLKNLLRPDAFAASAAAALTQPIFSGGTLEGQLGVATGRRQELLEDYRKAIIQALADVENALEGLRQGAAQERAQAAVVAAARRASEITRQRLREGTIDIVTLINTQQTLFQAQDQLAQARLQHLQAVVALYQALGGGWTRDLPPLSSTQARP